MKEIWKDIKEYEGIYQVSNLGNVKRLAYWHHVGLNNVSNIYRPERILKHSLNTSGYPQVCLTHNGKKSWAIYKLMADAFIPNPDNKPMVNHKDGNKLSLNLDNLEWCTYRENLDHAIKMGLRATCEKHGAAKLNNSNVIKIRELYTAKKFSIKQLAEKYNVAYVTMQQMLQGRTWKNI